MELCSVLCGSLDGRGLWGRTGTGICMAKSLHCSPETTTTLLIGYQFSSVQFSHSVVSDSSRPHGLQPTRLLHPWDFPGKSTGVGHQCLLCNWLYTNTKEKV